MHIVTKQQKEVIQVMHNNGDEMRKNIDKLQEEGWSDNTRISLAGTTMYRQTVGEKEIEFLKENHPEVEIQESTGSFLQTGPYVFLTEHEREIKA